MAAPGLRARQLLFEALRSATAKTDKRGRGAISQACAPKRSMTHRDDEAIRRRRAPPSTRDGVSQIELPLVPAHHSFRHPRLIYSAAILTMARLPMRGRCAPSLCHTHFRGTGQADVFRANGTNRGPTVVWLGQWKAGSGGRHINPGCR